MVLGYATYQRVHVETGLVYGGSVWSHKTGDPGVLRRQDRGPQGTEHIDVEGNVTIR